MRESGRRRAVEEGSDRVPGFLLDTNVVIAVLGQEDAVLARLEEASDLFFVLVIVLGELRFGARKSGRIEENLQRIEDFAAESNVLPCDEETSRRYGVVKDGLRRIGRPIPENDIWIAATGLRHGLVLVTRDSHRARRGAACRAVVKFRLWTLRTAALLAERAWLETWGLVRPGIGAHAHARRVHYGK